MFIIFNKALQNENVDVFCNTNDIYPTICDLYGLEFNNKLTQGYSVYSNDIENSLSTNNLGIFDNDYYTFDADKFEQRGDSLITNSNLNSFKQKINTHLEKQNLINLYYSINYGTAI